MKTHNTNANGIHPSHGKTRVLFSASLLALFLALPAGAATIIPVTNHSFESNTPTDGNVDANNRH